MTVQELMNELSRLINDGEADFETRVILSDYSGSMMFPQGANVAAIRLGNESKPTKSVVIY